MISMFINTFARNILDDLLSKSDITLEEILDAEVLDEIKFNGSQKFAIFIIKDVNNYLQMIQYIHQLNPNNTKLKRYQFLISEILSYDIPILIDYLFEPEPNIPNYQVQEAQRQQLLPLLFQPFQADYLNITQVGYLAKIIESIIRKRGNSLWNWLNNNQCTFDHLIKHLDVHHVTSIIALLITYEHTSQDINSEEYFTKKNLLLQRIYTILLNKIHNSELVNNCCEILIDICNKTQKFIQYIDHPQDLYTAACDSGFVKFLNVLIALLQYQLSSKNQDYSKYNSVAVNMHRPFSNEYLSFAFNSTLNVVQTNFGLFKLQILTIYQLFLQTEHFELLNLINHSDIYQQLYKYIKKFEFNNQLQILFHQITIFIFKNNSLNWIKDLIQKDLFLFISSTNTLKKQIIGQIKNPLNRGYFGILSQLSYELEEYENDSEDWNSYKQNVLIHIKNIEQNYYFGINPKGNYVEQIFTSTNENLQLSKQHITQIKPDSIEIEINNKQNNYEIDSFLNQRLRLSFPIKNLLSFSDINKNEIPQNSTIQEDFKSEPQDLDLDSFDVTEQQKKKICSSQNEFTKNSKEFNSFQSDCY